MIEAIRALLQFTTVLPLGKTAPFEAFARNTWLYPLAGYITGGIGAIIILLLPAPPAEVSSQNVGWERFCLILLYYF